MVRGCDGLMLLPALLPLQSLMILLVKGVLPDEYLRLILLVVLLRRLWLLLMTGVHHCRRRRHMRLLSLHPRPPFVAWVNETEWAIPRTIIDLIKLEGVLVSVEMRV
jgi:hypothetical protein